MNLLGPEAKHPGEVRFLSTVWGGTFGALMRGNWFGICSGQRSVDESESILASNFCWTRSELRWTTSLYKNVYRGLYRVLYFYGNVKLIAISGKEDGEDFQCVCQIVCKLCEPYHETKSESDLRCFNFLNRIIDGCPECALVHCRVVWIKPSLFPCQLSKCFGCSLGPEGSPERVESVSARRVEG